MPSTTQNTERLIRYLDSIAAVEPHPVRNRELVLMAVALLLAWVYLDAGAFADQQVIEEKVAQGCISQYAAGERYAKKKPLECVEMVEAPNSILTYPVSQ